MVKARGAGLGTRTARLSSHRKIHISLSVCQLSSRAYGMRARCHLDPFPKTPDKKEQREEKKGKRQKKEKERKRKAKFLD